MNGFSVILDHEYVLRIHRFLRQLSRSVTASAG
jgi:hypothetical protein